MTNYTDKMKMPTFTVDNTTNASGVEIPGIKRMFDIGLALKDSMMLWGFAGTGKSQSVHQWNKQKVDEYNKRILAGEKIKPWNPVVCDVRLSMKEPVDMQGIPVPVKNGNETQTVWAIPSMWPRETDDFSGGVIFLDEMNQGQPAILNAAFQLIQDRALGDYKVPEGYMIVAASNPSSINSSVSEFSIPLSNRFSHFNVKVDFNSWLDYRLNNGGNVDVMSFLKTQGAGMLYDTKNVEDRIGDVDNCLYTDIVVTPRSWEVIENLLNLPEEQFSLEEKHYYATGRLGSGIAAKLFAYIKDKAKYQDCMEILRDGKTFRSEEMDQFWATQISCINVINQTKDDKVCKEYIKNMVNAIRKLNNVVYKVHSISQLVLCKRVKETKGLFNPAIEAADLMMLTVKAMV